MSYKLIKAVLICTFIMLIDYMSVYVMHLLCYLHINIRIQNMIQVRSEFDPKSAKIMGMDPDLDPHILKWIWISMW